MASLRHADILIENGCIGKGAHWRRGQDHGGREWIWSLHSKSLSMAGSKISAGLTLAPRAQDRKADGMLHCIRLCSASRLAPLRCSAQPELAAVRLHSYDVTVRDRQALRDASWRCAGAAVNDAGSYTERIRPHSWDRAGRWGSILHITHMLSHAVLRLGSRGAHTGSHLFSKRPGRPGCWW